MIELSKIVVAIVLVCLISWHGITIKIGVGKSSMKFYILPLKRVFNKYIKTRTNEIFFKRVRASNVEKIMIEHRKNKVKDFS